MQFAQPLLAPGQVVGFLAAGLFQQGTDGRVAGHQGLAVVQALGGDLPGVIDPHQAGRVAPGGSRFGWPAVRGPVGEARAGLPEAAATVRSARSAEISS